MIAKWNGQVIAEAEKDELIYIEGNWYFPPTAIKKEFFIPSETHTTCAWKGEASYYNVVVGSESNNDAAWYYPVPKDGSIERVHKDYTNYVAFWRGVEVNG
ncbi:DUF427 domain-containing protein [Candidatus Saccharibacteria bacterium]|nr:MAG: DUF427 domain-containing protein [Candidatus Saccharibacteria bacterium]